MRSKKTREVAGSLYERYGAHLSWPARFAIALAVDGLDMMIDFLFGAIPPVHIFITGVQVLVGSAMFGAVGGLVQLLELLGLFVGPLVAALPMLTVACVIAYVVESWRNAETEEERIGIMITFAAYVLGSGIGFFLWKEDFIGFFSIFLLVGPWGILMRYIPSIARAIAPSIKWGWTAAGAGLVLAALLFCVGYLHWWIPDPEGFREDAWKALVAKADPMVSGALKADRLKIGFDTSILDTAGKVLRDARSSLADQITGKAKKQDGNGKEGTPEKPIVINRKTQPRYDATDGSIAKPTLPSKALAYVAENIIKPAEIGAITGPKADDVPDEVKKVKDRLKLGTMSAKMYMFDFVLERAKKIREDEIAALEKWRVWLAFGFAFLACLAVAQKSEFYESAVGGGVDDDEAPPF